MTTICYNHNNNNNNWVHFNSHDNQCFEDEEEEEEEALSLCDLPITSNNNSHQELLETISKNVVENDQQDFEFGPCLVGNTAIRSQDNMCNADEVFFQGQLLPLRHSVSYEKVEEEQQLTRKINRSMSDPRTMIRSNNGYKPRVRNLFHSHPSPSPQIRSRTLSHSSNPKSSSSLWSFLQVGLVKPQEIGLSDLKNRSKRFGSHNSNSSSNSSGTNNSITDQNQNRTGGQNPKSRINSKNTKKKQRLFFGGCKCSADSIERTIKEQVPKMKKTTKDQENMTQPTPTTTLLQDQAGKQTTSRHRTFEWLKQLSLAASAAAPPQSET